MQSQAWWVVQVFVFSSDISPSVRVCVPGARVRFVCVVRYYMSVCVGLVEQGLVQVQQGADWLAVTDPYDEVRAEPGLGYRVQGQVWLLSAHI